MSATPPSASLSHCHGCHTNRTAVETSVIHAPGSRAPRAVNAAHFAVSRRRFQPQREPLEPHPDRRAARAPCAYCGATVVRIVTDFPHSQRVIDHTWIPLADGTRLSARIWLPDGAEERPVPAVLEYI